MKDELGICLIGAGRAGMIHARNFKNKVAGAHMEAVCDVVPQALEAAADELGLKKAHADYRRALDDERVDAVVIVSPTDLHRQLVLDCAAAGKHIFCEKPMAMNVEECRSMIDACAAKGVKLQIGFMRRHDASFMRAKRLIDEGAIGDVVLVRSNTRGPSKPRPWMYDIKKSNGVLAELNSHDIDCVRWLAGSEIKTVYAIGGNYRNPEAAVDYPDYYDNVVMTGVFESGAQYSIDGSAYVQYGYDAKAEIVGTKGKLEVGRSSAEFVKCTQAGSGTSAPFIASWTDLFRDAYLEEDNSFVQCVLNDTQPKVTGMDGLMAVKIVEAGNRSIREQRPLVL